MDASGNVYVTGTSYDSVTSSDYATIKYYPNGDTAWVRRYKGPGNSSDGASAMALDPAGYIYVTGTSGTVKYDAQGSQLWVDSVGCLDIAMGTSGNVYVTGANGTIKYDSQGNRLWIDSLGGIAIAVDSSGNVYVTGTSYDSVTSNDYVTIKYDPAGNHLWVKTYNGGFDAAKAIAVDGSGNVYVTGSSWSETGYDYATIKYDSAGNELWVQRYNGSWIRNDEARAVAVDGSGNVYVTGYSDLRPAYADYVTIKYDSSGSQLWIARYNGPGPWGSCDDFATALAVDSSGNVYVTGNSMGSGTGLDYATVKYDPTGKRLWVQRYNNYSDYARAIAVDGSGNVYVTGKGGSDYATVKYWQNYPPDSFSLVSPSDSTVFSYGVTFHWQPATDPDPWDTTRYDLYLSTSPSFHPDSTIIYIGLLSSQQTDTLEIGSYYWKVRAYDKRSETWSNQTWTFRVQNYPPNTFSLLSPSDSAMIPYIVAFTWETATDPDPWDTAKYDLYVSTSSIFNPDSTVIYDSLVNSQYTDTLGLGRYYWKVRAYDTRLQTWSSQTWTLLSAIRGDANADKKVSVADVVYLINFLFRSGPAPNPFQTGDVNCDGYVTVADVVYLVNYLFKGGPPPAS